MSDDPTGSGGLRNWAYGLLTGLLFVEFFLFAWCRVQCVQTGYEANVARVQIEALNQDQKKLKAQLSLLNSPERIMRIGRERLGLVIPKPEQVMVVK